MASPIVLPSLLRPAGPVADRESVVGLEIARRVLADASVRSLTLDPARDEATVRYRGGHRGPIEQRASLSWLAQRYSADAALLEASTVVPLPVELVQRWPDEDAARESYVRAPEVATGWRRAMHLTLAAVWFTLAVLGAILPGLPCTCFLLLCSYSLCRSSDRLHQKLLDSRWFGPTLRHWRLHRGVRPGVKAKALGTMAAMIGITLIFAPLPSVVWWIVAAAGVIGAAVVMRLRVVEC
ncbi:YbaN family protein [Botrimarina mediterranea]|uniref:Inner membrane protein YbaN n=1 Tax=Botrimarina mediterranea TaxID=2528022 RepID=A0A518K3N4_9BACT|nr:YbaN family protein [Botrimarina mediterranea]QDV72365.1 Inner membrane protein YbaN [Botrimarina mediterranea]QDV76911.1 Inner membrane protein YbaN [Planctomycetes bacterium K2D]